MEVSRAEKNIHNTPHYYKLLQGDAAIQAVGKRPGKIDEICFDTETTGIDANDAELVGMSFSVEPGEGVLYSLSADQERNQKILSFFALLFSGSQKTWIGRISNMIC